MSIRIIGINEKDWHDLLKFEIDNRSFFEESCISRGDKYYEENNFKEILRELIKEQEQGIHYMYLIK
ncbi:MAG: N-acetyltransferase, partial [Clostridium sp.]